MLSVPELRLGFIDAVSYRKRGQKQLLNQLLYRERFLEQILDENRYFLIGEKGTGKTSYAVFLENNELDDHRARVVELNATDYQKFFKLKENGKLNVSTYSDIWRVVLLLLMCEGIHEKFGQNILNIGKFEEVKAAIDEYYANALSLKLIIVLSLSKIQKYF